MFALVRAGLPNTIVALALAALPPAALVVASDKSTQGAKHAAAAPIVAHADAVQRSAEAMAE